VHGSRTQWITYGGTFWLAWVTLVRQPLTNTGRLPTPQAGLAPGRPPSVTGVIHTPTGRDRRCAHVCVQGVRFNCPTEHFSLKEKKSDTEHVFPARRQAGQRIFEIFELEKTNLNNI